MRKLLVTAIAALSLVANIVSAQELGGGGVGGGGSGSGGVGSANGAVLMGVIGDSLAADNCQSDGVSNDSYFANGPMVWLQVLSLGRLYMPCDQLAMYNWATASTDTTNWLTVQIPEALASKAQWVSITIGRADINEDFCTNGMTAAATAAAEEANLLSMVRQLMAAGKSVLMIGQYPAQTTPWTCSAGALTTAAQEIAFQVNMWARELGLQNPPNNPLAGGISDLRSRAQYIFIDPSVYMNDPGTQSTSVSLAWPTCDYNIAGTFLHQADPCAYIIGAMAWAAIKPYVPGGPIATFLPPDIYSATNNPMGNLVTNGNLNGSGGTVNSPCSGVMATGVTLKRLSGSGTGGTECRGFKQVVYGFGQPAPSEVQGIWIAPDNSGTNPEVIEVQFQTISSSNYAVGDRIQFGCQVAVSASPNIVQVTPVLNMTGSVTYNGYGFRERNTSGDPYMPMVNWFGYVFTSGTVVTTGTTVIVAFFTISVDGTQLGTNVLVWLNKCNVRKVI